VSRLGTTARIIRLHGAWRDSSLCWQSQKPPNEGGIMALKKTIATVAGITLALAACGGSDDPTVTSTSTAPDATTTSAGEPSSGEALITIEDFRFGGVTEVAAGAPLTVMNNDNVTHTWTSDEGAFNSSGISPGDFFEIVISEPGTYSFFCSIHPTMTGTITVTG